jgi:putative ABC transport system permease protein
MKWILFAVKNVLRNRRRSAVTVLIAAVGTAAILVGGGFAQFTYESLKEQAARVSGHLVVAHRDHFAKDEDAPMQYGLTGHQALRTRLVADPRVRAVLPRIQFSGLISNGDKSAVFVGSGVDAAGEFAVRGPFLSVTAGGLLDPRPKPGDDLEIMLGKELARSLHAEPGSSLTLMTTTTEGSLNAQDVRVKGIFSVGQPEVDKRIVMVHLGTAQRLLLTEKVSTLSVYLHETAATDAAQAALRRELPDQAIQTWLDQASFYVAVRELYNRIFGLLGAVLVAMVLFAVTNTLGMAVLERTREIGTLRAMGTLPGQVVRNFALEGLVIGTAGAVLGMLVAVAISVTFDLNGFQMPPPPGSSVGYPLHVDLPPELFAATTAVIILSAVTAAWAVSRKAARKSIVEALAHV